MVSTVNPFRQRSNKNLQGAEPVPYKTEPTAITPPTHPPATLPHGAPHAKSSPPN